MDPINQYYLKKLSAAIKDEFLEFGDTLTVFDTIELIKIMLEEDKK